jgi:Zn-dependent M32 family carboxypeptidase
LFLIPYLASYHSSTVRSLSASLSSREAGYRGLSENYQEILERYPDGTRSPFAQRVFSHVERIIAKWEAEDASRRKRERRKQKKRESFKGFGPCA